MCLDHCSQKKMNNDYNSIDSKRGMKVDHVITLSCITEVVMAQVLNLGLKAVRMQQLMLIVSGLTCMVV